MPRKGQESMMVPRLDNAAISVLSESLNFTSPLEDVGSTPAESIIRNKLKKNTMTSPRFDKRLDLRAIPTSS